MKLYIYREQIREDALEHLSDFEVSQLTNEEIINIAKQNSGMIKTSNLTIVDMVKHIISEELYQKDCETKDAYDRIYLDAFPIKTLTNRELRLSHNIRKMIINGVFKF